MPATTFARVVPVALPLVLVAAAALYVADPPTYARMLQEDGPVEWATVVLLLTGAALALARRRRGASERRFLLLLGAFLGLAALEELSWGQRLLGVESPAFFLRHSDQQEINLHNVFQPWAGFTIKWIAAFALSAYGIALPLLRPRVPAVDAWVRRWGVLVPPHALAPGFVVGALLMIDLPTHDEEELGELMYALCFVLLLAWPGEARA